MSPLYYGPDEDPDTIFLERTFLAGDFVSGIGYGIQLVLYTSCVARLWKSIKTRPQSLYILIYITTLLCVETIFEVAQARTVQIMYIDNRNYPGGPWEYFLATQNLPINVTFISTLFTLTFLADILVLWRCWIIWCAFGKRAAYLITAFPAILLLGSFVMGVLWTLQSSQPGLSLYSSLPLAYGTSYYAISLSVNIILTILITTRLLTHRRSVMKSLPKGHGNYYVSLVTIIVESAALYSVFAILFLITYAVNNPMNSMFLTIASFCQQISNYLILIRLSEGKTWQKDTIAQIETSIYFGTNQHANTATIIQPEANYPSDTAKQIDAPNGNSTGSGTLSATA